MQSRRFATLIIGFLLGLSVARADDSRPAPTPVPAMKGNQVLVNKGRELGSITKRTQTEDGEVFEVQLHDGKRKLTLRRNDFLLSLYNYEGDGFQNLKMGDLVLFAPKGPRKPMAPYKVVRVYENGETMIEPFINAAKVPRQIVPRESIEKVVENFPAVDGSAAWHAGQKVFSAGSAEPSYITYVSEKGTLRFYQSVKRTTKRAGEEEFSDELVAKSVNHAEVKRPLPVEYWPGYLDVTDVTCVNFYKGIGARASKP